MGKRKTKKTVRAIEAIIAAVIIVASAIGYTIYDNQPIVVEGDVSVHYIDVGQGDSTLIKVKDKTILIDAGENDQGNTVVNYLKKQNIDQIDMLIGTHPHSDHIGGLDAVINHFDIGEIIMPKVADNLVPTTKTYTEVLTAISNKNDTITPAQPGQTYSFNDATLTILGPLQEYDDLNDCSVVAKFEYGNTSFLFGGDMEKPVEKHLLNEKANVRSTVFKLSHHGSNTSNTQNFLDAVKADYYVIPVGSGNKYGHPHQEILKRIEGTPTYRTDKQGTIVIQSDGQELKIQTEK